MPPGFGDKFKILIGKLDNGNLGNIDLLISRQGQQNINRAFEAIDVNDKGGRVLLAGRVMAE